MRKLPHVTAVFWTVIALPSTPAPTGVHPADCHRRIGSPHLSSPHLDHTDNGDPR
jgi:hypothetical protein